MIQSDIKIGVIGCGRVAGHHCRSITATPGVSLAATCDTDAEKSQAYGAEFDVPSYTNYNQMLKQHSDIDVIAIVTPSGMHAEHAQEIIGNHRRHIIVEKPTFMRPSQLDTVYDLAGANNCRVFPVFQNRYNKAVRRVKHALDNGELGDIRLVNVRLRWCRPQRYYDMAAWRGTFSHDGGALTNQGIHHVDLLRHLGGEVETITATMRTLGADIDVEDSVVATLTYATNAIGSLEVTTAARPDDFEASISIVGSEGLAQLGGIAVNELQIFTPNPAACAQNSVDFKSVTGHGAVYGFGHGDMYADIVADFAETKPYPVSREDCRATLTLLHAFYRSDESGGPVVVQDGGESGRLGRPDDAISKLYRTPEHE